MIAKLKHSNPEKKLMMGIDTHKRVCYNLISTRTNECVIPEGRKMNTALWEAREASGMTQAQVAEAANIAVRAYQNYEYNTRTPSVRTAIRIATALNSTVEALFSGEKKGE